MYHYNKEVAYYIISHSYMWTREQRLHYAYQRFEPVMGQVVRLPTLDYMIHSI